MDEIAQVKNKKILLDTNILINYGVENFRERSGNILRVLLNNQNKLAVSEITGLELLQGETEKSKIEFYLKMLNFISNLDVSRSVLLNAISLSSGYRRIKTDKKGPSVADLIIGGTVLAHDSLLLTADRKDFSEPMWGVVAHKYVFDDKKSVIANLYLLKFDENKLIGE